MRNYAAKSQNPETPLTVWNEIIINYCMLAFAWLQKTHIK